MRRSPEQGGQTAKVIRRVNNKRTEVEIDNRWMVPYNAALLLLSECHINVEVASTIQAVKYLYKYVFKGPDKIMYKIQSSNSKLSPDSKHPETAKQKKDKFRDENH